MVFANVDQITFVQEQQILVIMEFVNVDQVVHVLEILVLMDFVNVLIMLTAQ